MKKLGVSLSAYEAKKVFARFPGRDGTVRLRDFYDAVGRGDARDPPGVAAVKREVKRLAKSRDGPPDFARELRKSTDARVIDSARDLRRSLEAMDIEITRDEAAGVLEAVGGRDGAPKEEPAGFRLLRSEIRRLGQRSEGRRTTSASSALWTATGRATSSRASSGGAWRSSASRLSSEDLRAVVDKLDVDGDGRVSLREFLKFADGAGDDRTTRLERAVFKEVRRLARGRRTRLRDAFLEFDDNDSGKINKREFRRALERLGFELSADDVDGLVDRFDVDGDGKVSYAEFVGWCDRGAGAGAREEDQDDVLKLLRDACRDRLDGGSSPRAVFERLDRDGDGTVDEDEFARGLRKLGLELTAYEVRKAMDRFPGRRGRVKYDDFLEAVKPSRGASSGAGSKLGFEFDGGEFDRVVERLDRDGDGTVSLREFLKFAEGAGSRPEDSDDAVDEVMGRLRGLVRDAVQDGLSPADCFEHFDRDGSGDVDEREFTKG
ncbi:Ca2-binding protein [Aureococcus anophagefferens]|nr:Ca2-binding protein [Aureococcus anophagefferens]